MQPGLFYITAKYRLDVYIVIKLIIGILRNCIYFRYLIQKGTEYTINL